MAVAGALAALVPWLRRRGRAQIVHVTADPSTGKARRKVVLSAPIREEGRRIFADAGDAELNVAGLTAFCECRLPDKYLDAGYEFTLTQHGNVVYVGPALAAIRVVSGE